MRGRGLVQRGMPPDRIRCSLFLFPPLSECEAVFYGINGKKRSESIPSKFQVSLSLVAVHTRGGFTPAVDALRIYISG